MARNAIPLRGERKPWSPWAGKEPVITETSTPDHYEEDLPLFDEIIKSFQFVLPAE
jgi:hypothetical protein